jgi:predicted O-methyltransferase YrrM
MSSITAARLIATLNWKVDLIYLDSAHEIGETFAELYVYFQLLRKGGLLIGDDYKSFPAVQHDVDLFCKYKAEELTFELIQENQWTIKKLE